MVTLPDQELREESATEIIDFPKVALSLMARLSLTVNVPDAYKVDFSKSRVPERLRLPVWLICPFWREKKAGVPSLAFVVVIFPFIVKTPLVRRTAPPLTVISPVEVTTVGIVTMVGGNFPAKCKNPPLVTVMFPLLVQYPFCSSNVPASPMAMFPEERKPPIPLTKVCRLSVFGERLETESVRSVPFPVKVTPAELVWIVMVFAVLLELTFTVMGWALVKITPRLLSGLLCGFQLDGFSHCPSNPLPVHVKNSSLGTISKEGSCVAVLPSSVKTMDFN